MAPLKWQNIMWANEGYFADAYMRYSASTS